MPIARAFVLMLVQVTDRAVLKIIFYFLMGPKSPFLFKSTTQKKIRPSEQFRMDARAPCFNLQASFYWRFLARTNNISITIMYCLSHV